MAVPPYNGLGNEGPLPSLLTTVWGMRDRDCPFVRWLGESGIIAVPLYAYLGKEGT